MSFSLYQPNVFEYLKNGQTLPSGEIVSAKDWFRGAVAASYTSIAAAHDCEINMAGRRLDEARELWANDIKNIKIEDSSDADHLKQAGFLAYWLRRRIVIAVNHENPGSNASDAQRDFLKYGSEVASFLTGFRIALYFEIEKRHGAVRQQQLEAVSLESTFVKDIAILLHHKNVSPHSLYLIYRSLFYSLRVPPRDDGNVIPLRPQIVK